MPSPKRRTTSSSGSSAPSTTKATSRRPESSSQTPPASFETVFGTAHPETQRLLAMKESARAKLEAHQRTPLPEAAILRTQHAQRTRRLQRLLQAIEADLTKLGVDCSGNR